MVLNKRFTQKEVFSVCLKASLIIFWHLPSDSWIQYRKASRSNSSYSLKALNLEFKKKKYTEEFFHVQSTWKCPSLCRGDLWIRPKEVFVGTGLEAKTQQATANTHSSTNLLSHSLVLARPLSQDWLAILSLWWRCPAGGCLVWEPGWWMSVWHASQYSFCVIVVTANACMCARLYEHNASLVSL